MTDLHVDNLSVTYGGPAPVRAVDDVSFTVAPGECLGIMGESGSGKSTLAKALLGLVDEAEVKGAMSLGDVDLTALDEDTWRSVRWRRIALSFQSTTALNPVLRVGDQIAEPLEIHLEMKGREAARRAGELLDEVGLSAEHASRYPNELSGGQRRLALLAMALACNPEVLLLDEPTVGLDPLTRAHVLDVLGRLRGAGRTAMVVLSHDADALELLADRALVLYRGWAAETGPAPMVLGRPRSPYAWALLNARPTLASVKDLRGIRGDAPNPTDVAAGCPFSGRCTQAVAECEDGRPPLVAPLGEDGSRLVSCVRGGLVELLAARGLRKTYRSRTGLVRSESVAAVDGIDLVVREGEAVGLVGATGAGKSTLASLLVGLLSPDEGTVVFEGMELGQAGGSALKAARRRLQMLFQDPYEALSARMTIAQAVREPLDVQKLGTGAERDVLVRSTLSAARLPADDAFLARHTHELSGGQLQRVALARALVLEPKLLIADEPVSMLDPSEQAKMIQLLKHLQVERGMAMIFVSHDLSVVLRVADRVVVIDGGKVVEEATGSEILVSPRHDVTRGLLAASGRDALFERASAAYLPLGV
ncbi:MAG TPA: ABC transporter ATP-binding protein [Acidimicrobiales bacterium]|nr:ABC transporter ATP-binding protein [Acidimicrobiales bacterium]